MKVFLQTATFLAGLKYIQALPSNVAPQTSATESFRPIFTIPSNVDNGANLIPTHVDPQAVDSQSACPGYKASNVKRSQFGLSAILTLAGKACNTYGTDVQQLNLTVQYQASDRLSVKILPLYIGSANSSWFILPEDLVPSPQLDQDFASGEDNDLSFVWSNEPSFQFSVIRKANEESIFSTFGTKIIYQNQFLEFVTSVPENYNLYGLGEVIHGLRLGNNLTRVSS
jgi:alpha-glucosidase